jgi:lipopolysaccharide export system protein LptA
MKLPETSIVLLAAVLTLFSSALPALESDRQQPLEVKADSTDGTLGDGIAVLRGHVVIEQGSMVIRADRAEVEKVDGKVRKITLTGKPVYLQQEIEEEGLVQARANRIEYLVASGMVTFTGAANVEHPQYKVSGEILKYDMNEQHFQGSGGDRNGRLRIRLDPEVVPGLDSEQSEGGEEPAEPASQQNPPEEEA